VNAAVAYAVWALLGVAGVALWLGARTPGSRTAGPMQVARRLATGPFLRVVLALAVVWAGWHLFAR
jgi:hypothetical protein